MSAGVKSETNYVDLDIPSTSSVDLTTSCRPNLSIAVSEEDVMNSENQTKICDSRTNSSSTEVLSVSENKNGCSSNEAQSACCGSSQSKSLNEQRLNLNGVSHLACSRSTGDNGISKHLTACEFGGARPKTTNSMKDIKPEMVASNVNSSDCDCENTEMSCDNTDSTWKKQFSDADNPSACIERDKCLDDLLVQLENTTLKGSDETVLSNVINGIDYFVYESEKQMPDIMRLITKDLSEPYSIYTYRYFIHNWPKLCFLAMADGEYVGAIVCKLDVHKKLRRRGYIAMLAVDSRYRRRAIGSTLVTKAIQAMIRDDCDEVVLETEISNMGALHLYQNLGFVRDKRLFRYYLNGVDALRLKLWLR